MGSPKPEASGCEVGRRTTRGFPAVLPAALKWVRGAADSEDDSQLGTDGNHEPAAERREGAADDAALLIPAVDRLGRTWHTFTRRNRTCPGSDPGFSPSPTSLDFGGIDGRLVRFGQVRRTFSCTRSFLPACDHARPLGGTWPERTSEAKHGRAGDASPGGVTSTAPGDLSIERLRKLTGGLERGVMHCYDLYAGREPGNNTSLPTSDRESKTMQEEGK